MNLKPTIVRFLVLGSVSTMLLLGIASIAKANGKPVAADDFASITHEQPVTLDVLANDSDPDGDDLLILQVFQPGLGSVEIAPDGKSIVYTAGFCGQWTDTFSYHVADPSGAQDAAQVTVVVDAGLTCIQPLPDEVTFMEGTHLPRHLSGVSVTWAGACIGRRCTGTGFVGVATVDVTTTPDDYVLKNSGLGLHGPFGVRTAHIFLLNDQTPESTESFLLILSGVTVIDGSDPVVTVFITDDD